MDDMLISAAIAVLCFFLGLAGVLMSSEGFFQWLAWLLPRRLVYFVGIRIWANATQGKYGQCNAIKVTCSDAIDRWKVDGSGRKS